MIENNSMIKQITSIFLIISMFTVVAIGICSSMAQSSTHQAEPSMSMCTEAMTGVCVMEPSIFIASLLEYQRKDFFPLFTFSLLFLLLAQNFKILRTKIFLKQRGLLSCLSNSLITLFAKGILHPKRYAA